MAASHYQQHTFWPSNDVSCRACDSTCLLIRSDQSARATISDLIAVQNFASHKGRSVDFNLTHSPRTSSFASFWYEVRRHWRHFEALDVRVRISGLSEPSGPPALMRLARSSSEGNLNLRDQTGISSSEELLTDGENGILRKFSNCFSYQGSTLCCSFFPKPVTSGKRRDIINS